METTVKNFTENEDLTPVKDERIVRLNEIIATKLSAVSKSKREKLKADKTAAKFILENWDNEEVLDKIASEEFKQTYYELYCIAKSRIDQLSYQANKHAEEELKAKQEAERKEIEEREKRLAELKAKKESKKEPTAESKKRGRKSTLNIQVGDSHPEHPDWIWTEYKPGKFDWRSNKGKI